MILFRLCPVKLCFVSVFNNLQLKITTMNIEKLTTWKKVAGKYSRVTLQRNFTPNTNQKAELIFVMIPGNPGNDQFYDNFGQNILIEMVEHQLNIPIEFHCVAYLNHVELPNNLINKSDIKRDDLFILSDQITHKFDYFIENIPKKTPIILIGHSIGAYMSLKILPQLISSDFNVIKFLGLFPGIEQLALSPNGIKRAGFLKFLDKHSTLLKICLSWLWLIPNSFKRFFVRLNLRDSRIPKCVIESVMETISSSVTRNIIHLVNDEFKIVKNRDDSLFLNEYRNRIILYYGENDGWVPEICVEEQVARLGKSCVVLDKDGCDHAFVNLEGEIMARNVVSLIKQCLKT